ncbi:AraC family transcriptional regulator [Mesorhizobium sp. WSM3859]|uniref:helix-turn-helix domain-containing protein n=1 Tax=Mesorhizobium sp. WSM3859 TaxID=2029402 RepID=UPI000BAEFEF6|nr:AraC family transcriptional regulator [Mesorhizobium sp. WSM3859]PBC11167.1 AraC family transcriptional regulator [Mesorhizobium sp. WSM3859]
MKLSTHSDRKYQGTTDLIASLHFSSLRIDRRRLKPGHHKPGVCQCHELVFVLAGRTYALQSANGMTHRNFIRPGISCVCPAGTFEKASGTTSPLESLHIYLPPDLIERSAAADYDVDPAKAELSYTGALEDPKLYGIAMAFREALGQPMEPAERLYLDGMQAALAAYLIEKYSVDRWVRSGRLPDLDGDRLERVIDYIEAHFADDIGLAELAAQASVSEYHLGRLFRATIGVPPHRYVNFRRVQEAQKWLEKSRLPMPEIASMTGFASSAGFARVFRNLTGLSPRAYRAVRHG